MTYRTRIIPICQRLVSERKLRADVLSERRAFTAFPRLEFSSGKQLHRLDVSSALVQQRAKFHHQIITLRNKLGMIFQFAQTLRRFFAKAFPKLVALVKQSRVG